MMGRRMFWVWKEDRWFLLLLAGLLVYYGWRLFCVPPWYDELYTYETFIDRGMIYSMIHWPLPNNHVFYSALSAVINKLGNPYIGLRGISFLASAGSLILLYRLLKKAVSPWLGLAAAALFAAMYNVTLQAVQGRGYALSGFFLLLSVSCLYEEICIPEGRRRLHLYLLFAVSLVGGLYTIPSNLYWVVSVCLTGGIYLLLHRQYQVLWRLIAASVCAAFVTFGLYTIIWLAIGSNFMVKEADSAFYGMSHLYVLSHVPFQAFSRGMQAMLSDPNIQSISRSAFMEGVAGYISRLMNQVYPSGAVYLPWLIIAGMGGTAVQFVMSLKRGKRGLCFLSLYSLLLTVMVPVFLFVQCVFPYLRVFTYMGSVLSILFIISIYTVLELVTRKKYAYAAAAGVSVLLMVWNCHMTSYNEGYDSRDNHIYKALETLDATNVRTVLTGDDYAQLNLYYHLQRVRGMEITVDSEQPDYILMDKQQTGEGGNSVMWPLTLSTEDFPWEWIENHMEVVYEDDMYIAYQVK